MKNFTDNIIDFLFPKISIITGNKISDSNSNPYVEDEIIGKMEILSENDIQEIKSKLESNEAYSHFLFSDKYHIKEVIHNIKYRGFKKAGMFFGTLLGNALINKYGKELEQYRYIVPVPLHSAKERDRGYNQSEYICRGISKIINIPVNNTLIFRKIHTKSQASLPMRERKLNVQGAFDAVANNHSLLNAAGIILVDDVVTTGSTLNEVIKTLKKSGAGNIFVVTLASAII